VLAGAVTVVVCSLTVVVVTVAVDTALSVVVVVKAAEVVVAVAGSKHLLTISKASLRSLALPKMHCVCVAKGWSNKSNPHPGITALVILNHAATDSHPSCGAWKNVAPDWANLLEKPPPGKRVSMSATLMGQFAGIMCTSPAPWSAGWNRVEK
jgi:hypothetical protein